MKLQIDGIHQLPHFLKLFTKMMTSKRTHDRALFLFAYLSFLLLSCLFGLSFRFVSAAWVAVDIAAIALKKVSASLHTRLS